MTTAWRTLPFSEVFADVSSGQPKTFARDFLPAGRYPLVDQGKDLIGGYTNDESRLSTAELPLIVFGDHTRAVKYVDFPFGVGADGVKLLRPRVDAHVPFLYRFLDAARIPAAGYDRHFKYLKRITVPLPPVEEQRRIAALLDQADELRARRKSSLALLESLTEAIFLDLFGDMDARETCTLAELVDPSRPIRYGILKPGPHVLDGRPYVRVVDMKHGGIDCASVRCTSPEIHDQYRRSVLRAGDLLMSIRGHVGRLAAVPPQLDGANITQDSARIAVVGALPQFVLTQLRSRRTQLWMERHVRGAAVRGINIGDVRRIPISVPPQVEQEQFVERVRAIEALEVQARHSAVAGDTLFASLQHRAFSGAL